MKWRKARKSENYSCELSLKNIKNIAVSNYSVIYEKVLYLKNRQKMTNFYFHVFFLYIPSNILAKFHTTKMIFEVLTLLFEANFLHFFF